MHILERARLISISVSCLDKIPQHVNNNNNKKKEQTEQLPTICFLFFIYSILKSTPSCALTCIFAPFVNFLY